MRASFKSRRLTLLLVLVGCTDGSGPSQPQLRVLSGAGISDTISHVATQPLLIEITRGGQPQQGVEVRFAAPLRNRMRVAALNPDSAFGVFVSTLTDGAGRAAVRVSFGTQAGAGSVFVTVLQYALEDTASYTVLPGAPVRVALLPKDTFVVIGARFTYASGIKDRAGNGRDTSFFESVGASVQMDAGGSVTTRDYGTTHVRVRATLGGVTYTDSGTVSVLPAGRIAWTAQDGSLVISDLAGANPKVLAPRSAQSSWAPTGDRLVYNNEAQQLVIVDTTGIRTILPTPDLTSPGWPEWSADGHWIYFQAGSRGLQRINRIRPDGSGLELLNAPLTPRSGASPSPDGTRVVFADSPNGGFLIIRDLVMGVERVVPSSGGNPHAIIPRWSPNGEWIAFTPLCGGNVALVRPGGNDPRGVGHGGMSCGISWSPDSRWIVGSFRPNLALPATMGTLIDVTTGLTIDLPWKGKDPAWRR
jgi:hypothetical protein